MLWSLTGGAGTVVNALRCHTNTINTSVSMRFLILLTGLDVVFIVFVFGKVYAKKQVGVPELSEC